MKIFGIGLSRTGTTSLSEALKILGFKTVHFNIDQESRIEIYKGNFKNKSTEEHDAIIDTPMCNYYKEYDLLYPNSKFIFTKRNIKTWLNSCKTFFKVRNEQDKFKFNLTRNFISDINWTAYANIATYGIKFYNEERFKNVYIDHLKEIKDYFKNRESDILYIDICDGEGWEKLCPFLNKKKPLMDFPHENKIQKRIPYKLI